MANEPHDDFFDTLPVFLEFEGVADVGNYKPLPDDWVLGDGGYCRLHQGDRGRPLQGCQHGRRKRHLRTAQCARQAELSLRFWRRRRIGGTCQHPRHPLPAKLLRLCNPGLRDDLQLNLRAALVPMRDIRAGGLDVRVARFKVSPDVSYAMFAGGGASWAEAQMKAGEYAIEPAPSGTRPDLTGLSCRWNPIEARNGEIVSIIAIPGTSGASAQFQELVTDDHCRCCRTEPRRPPASCRRPTHRFQHQGHRPGSARHRAGRQAIFRRKFAILVRSYLLVALDRLGTDRGRFRSEDATKSR